MGTPQRCDTHFRQPQVTHLAHAFLDRYRAIEAVQIPQVDVVRAESLQAAFERAARVGGRTVDAGYFLIGRAVHVGHAGDAGHAHGAKSDGRYLQALAA